MIGLTDVAVLKTAFRMPAVWRLRILQRLAQWGIREETLLIFLALLIGAAGGAAAWVFKSWVELLFQALYEIPARSWHATTYIFLLPLLPLAGGLCVSLVRWLFRTGKSPFHGLTGVLLSLIRSGGKLPHKTGLETLLASGLTIGSGGSAGPEAPIAIIGSSLGSSLGVMAGISRRYLPTLVGCGAAAGISAVFDAPIAGVLFALEVMLRDFSVYTFTPIVVSSVIATVTFHSLVHVTPGHPLHGLFEMSSNSGAFGFTFHDLPNYALLGVLCGLVAIAFSAVLRAVEKASDRMRRVPVFLRPALGAGLAGLCGVLLILLFRQDLYVQRSFAESAYVPIFGSGYPTILRAIDPSWYTPSAHAVQGHAAVLALGFLLAVCVLKILATALTLGSGGSGGVFAPSLFIGASFGGSFGLVLSHFVPHSSPSAYALVGMGAVLAAVVQAPLMSIILLFEVTRDYAVMLPIMLTSVIATLMYHFVFHESLYTRPLHDRGIRLGSAAGISVLRRIVLEQLTLEKAIAIEAGQPVAELIRRMKHSPVEDYLVVDELGHYLGIVSTNDLQRVLLQQEAVPLLLVGDICRSDIPPLLVSDTLETAVDYFSKHDINALAVLRREPREEAIGVLTRADAMNHYHAALG